MQRDKTRLKLLSFLLNPFGKSEEEARRKPGRDQAGLCYLWVPHPQATPLFSEICSLVDRKTTIK